jgi:hypothetical protein
VAVVLKVDRERGARARARGQPLRPHLGAEVLAQPLKEARVAREQVALLGGGRVGEAARAAEASPAAAAAAAVAGSTLE